MIDAMVGAIIDAYSTHQCQPSSLLILDINLLKRHQYCTHACFGARLCLNRSTSFARRQHWHQPCMHYSPAGQRRIL